MRAQRVILIVAIVLGVGYAWLRGGFVGLLDGGTAAPVAATDAPAAVADTAAADRAPDPADLPLAADGTHRLALATFASGCFWCTESDFDKVPGVVSTTSGYTGGHVANPTYQQVSAGGTGHAESVEVLYDPAIVTYEQLLDTYWHNVDPFVTNRQFCDVGSQYRPEIFYHSPEQQRAAEASKARIQQEFDQPVLVRIDPAGPFYPAEPYHQDYHDKNPLQYRYYRWGCGRDARLAQIWGTPADTD